MNFNKFEGDFRNLTTLAANIPTTLPNTRLGFPDATTTSFGTLSMYDFSSFTDPRLRKLAEAITSRYLGQFELTSTELTKLADSFYDEAFSRGVMPRPYLMELLQLIVNACIYQAADHQRHFDPISTENTPSWFALLNHWGTLLPTHTLRDFDKNDMQQYSTPPELAYMAAWCAQPRADDVFMEPSCGLAGLACMVAPWVKASIVNEYDPERIELLRQLPGWSEVLQGDAGKIHLHSFTVTGKPTLVVMNPPFSMDCGERDKMTGARHIESALTVLQEGGRLVAILPGGIERSFNAAADDEAQFGMAPEAATFRTWWKNIMKTYTVRCNIGIEGAVYKKFGTGTRTRLVVIDKVGPQGHLETITHINGKPWVSSPLMLIQDQQFVTSVVTSRPRCSQEEIAKIRNLMLTGRLDGISVKGRERYGMAAAAVDPVSGLTPREQLTTDEVMTLPVSLCKVDSQYRQVEQQAARILFTLGLGGLLYESESINITLDRGQKRKSGLMDLNIERQGNELFMTHWFEQQGDLCRDSEVRFLAPMDSGLLKLTGITGWGPHGEFNAECKKSVKDDQECRSFASMMLKNISSLLKSSDVDNLKVKVDGEKRKQVDGVWQPKQAKPEPIREEIITVEAEEVKESEMMDIFQGYRPFVTVTGSKPHNVTLVESNTMRLATLPIATSPVHLPKEAVELGHISSAQLENVIMAIHAHAQFLRDGVTRKAYLIGDGTGVGKGTEGASVAMHYFLKSQGKVRIVWVSKEFSLVKDAQRDWKFIGGDENFIYTQDKFKDKVLPLDKGILFTTYSTMSMRGSADNAKSINRVEQIVGWMGDGNARGYDTLFIFDESHLMGNATSQKGARGDKKASQRAMAGLEIMESLPASRVLFLSATAATEVHNLGYAATRLGLCGPEIPAFPDLATFINKISGSGMLGMELVAKDMKAMGLYHARSLSYDGTEFSMVEHPLSEAQVSLYNEACYFWRLCYDYMKSSFEQNDTDGHGKARTMGQFWGGAQRFFNQILVSMQAPTAIEDMLKELAGGGSIVVQLVNTNEAATNRVVADALLNDVDIDELDITPRDMLLQLIKTSYPVIQYEKTKDGNNNTVKRPMTDANGDFVINPAAVEMRDELLLRVAEMRVPDGALDMLIERMEDEGYSVAEITGRSRRYVWQKDEAGNRHRIMETRSKRKGDAEAAEFMAGKRRVLIFSGAGNTGRSFQSDLRCQNQQRRYHYVLQAGWIASEAIQGLGRTHRTNQANAPHYKLVTTNLPGQKRFITSIARRIEQLGSLTRGNRAAAANAMFNASDNLETSWAKEAVNAIFMGLYLHQKHMVEAMGDNIGFTELCDMMGFNILDPESGAISTERIPGITQFLNRVLFLPVDLQHRLFGLFEETHTEIVENARAEGLLDLGVEKIKGDEIIKVKEKLAHVDKDTGARTQVVQLDIKTKLRRLQFDEAYFETDTNVMGTKMSSMCTVGYYLADNVKGVNFCGTGGFRSFIVNTVSNRIYATWNAGMRTHKTGAVEMMVRLVGPTTTIRQSDAEFNATKHRQVGPAEARRIWDAELQAATDYDVRSDYLVTGAVMPVWDKLGTSSRKVRIMVAETTDTKERILGRLIFEDEVTKVMSNLGMGSTGVYMTPKQLMDAVTNDANVLHLANGWQIRRRRLQSGVFSMVIIGIATRAEMVGIEGLTAEVQGRDWVNVLATPLDEAERLRIFTKFVEHRPVVRIDRKGSMYDVLDKQAEKDLEKAEELAHIEAYSFDDLIVYHVDGLKKLGDDKAAPGVTISSLFEDQPKMEVVFNTPETVVEVLRDAAVTRVAFTPEPEYISVEADPFEVVSNPNAVELPVNLPAVMAAQPDQLAPVQESPKQLSALERMLQVARQNAKQKSPEPQTAPKVQLSLW